MTLKELKQKKEELALSMPMTLVELKIRNKKLFEVCKQIEQIENSVEYEKNKNHWEGEMRNES